MFSLVAVLALGGAAVASAQTVDCSVTPCGNGDPMLITMPWGLTGYQTPTVERGAIIDGGFGFVTVCPMWYPIHMKCFDLTGTDYWKNQLRVLGYIK